MNTEFAWFLGLLASDGSIIRPTYRKKGDETHLAFCMHCKDSEVLRKVKTILNTRGKVRLYPDYKSPQSVLHIYDRKDIVRDYSDIKEKIPDVTGYERHFIRGLVDGDGCLYRMKNTTRYTVTFINREKNITDWVAETLSAKLDIPLVRSRFVHQSNIFETRWNGKISRFVAWYLYHGDIGHCVLERKLNKWKTDFNGMGLSLIDASISMNTSSKKTLEWCHRIQKQAKDLGLVTTPVPRGKGKTKYYELHVSGNNTQNALQTLVV